MFEDAKFEIGFQQADVPVSTTVGEFGSTPLVIYGLNLENYNPWRLKTGKIMERRGSVVNYRPSPILISSGKKGLKFLPKKELVWLLGDYDERGFMDVHDFGKRADFPYPDIAKRMEADFNGHFHPEVFEYAGKFKDYYKLNVKCTVRLGELGGERKMFVLNDEGKEVSIISKNFEKLEKYDGTGEKISFEALMEHPGKTGVERIYPLV